MKNHPNTNTNIIRFENISRIRIRISLFGLNYSNIIRIPNYSLTSDLFPQTQLTLLGMMGSDSGSVGSCCSLHYGLSPIEKGKLRILQNEYLGPHFQLSILKYLGETIWSVSFSFIYLVRDERLQEGNILKAAFAFN